MFFYPNIIFYFLSELHVPKFCKCCNLFVVGVFILLIRPPKSDRLKGRGQTK